MHRARSHTSSIVRNTTNMENKRRPKNGDNENEQREKTFDKKKYRLQKYSNRYKIDQWEEKRKKAMLRGLYKEFKEDQQNFAQTLTDLSNESKNETSKSKKKGFGFYKAKQEAQRKKEEKKKKVERALCVKAEREEALKKYKEKKMRNFKALSKRTKKGQPIMKDRIEILLEKIQQDLT